MSYDQQLPPPPPGQPGYQVPPPGQQGYQVPPAPQQGTSGLAVTGLIFAFLVAPLGFLLSLIAVFKTGAGRAKGRGLAIAGLVISVLIMGGGAALGYALASSTVADPGCTAGKQAIIDGSKSTDAAALKNTIDGLTAAAAKAKHDNVRAAMKGLADDYSKFLDAAKTGNVPAGMEAKIEADGKTIDSLCSIGS